MNVDVEIYCKKLKTFFTNNPLSKDELLDTVPGVTFESFMEKVVEISHQNFEKIGDPSLTKKQILDVLNDLYLQYMQENHLELAKEVGLITDTQVPLSQVFQKLNGFLIGLN
tara:strand:+ start:1087 stop:1422 length:336 start_codon:yes stop_codon:yes gene_type:complete